MSNNKLRIPTKEEFARLCECYTRFDNKDGGRWFFDRETCDELFFPCQGYFCDNGFYWSSTLTCATNAYYFFFDSEEMDPMHSCGLEYRRGIRLVSDEPFDGAIHVAGLYWKPEIEEDRYTWEEAMAKFNNKY